MEWVKPTFHLPELQCSIRDRESERLPSHLE
jgi:hypothetical protein